MPLSEAAGWGDPETLVAIGGVAIASLLVVLQLRLLHRQFGLSDDQLELSRRQTSLTDRQVELADRQQQLDVLERAKEIWASMGENDRVGELFRKFPRTAPHPPWDPTYADAHPQQQEVLSLAQRIVAWEELKTARRGDPELDALIREARRQVGLLNDLAELLDWNLISVLPVMQKWHSAIVQRVWLLEPLILSTNLSATGARWGMRVLRLGVLARWYHDVSTIQGARPISISAPAWPDADEHPWPDHGYGGPVYAAGETPFGGTLPAGTRRTAEADDIPETLFPADGKQAQNDWLRRLGEAVEAVRAARPAGA